MSNSIWRTLQTKTLSLFMYYTQYFSGALPLVFYGKSFASHPGPVFILVYETPKPNTHSYVPSPVDLHPYVKDQACPLAAKIIFIDSQIKNHPLGIIFILPIFLEHMASLWVQSRFHSQRGKTCSYNKSSLVHDSVWWQPSCLECAYHISPTKLWAKHNRVSRKRKVNSNSYIAGSLVKCRFPGFANKII